MARTTEDAAITTKAARDRLAPQHEPYWRDVDGSLSLGYRKGPRGGVWKARIRDGNGYRKTTIGRADDVVAATVGANETIGAHETAAVLDFRQAQIAATTWAKQKHRVAAGLEAASAATPTKPISVADIIRDYMVDYGARGGKSLVQTRNAVAAHILPSLGTELVTRLTRDKLRKWHRGLASAPARLRSANGKINLRSTDKEDDDAPRRRRSTANRVLTILKAALNHAHHEGSVTCTQDAWAAVLPFRGADAPKIRYLTDEETTRLINACAGDFRNLVLAALLTGCRYGELMKLKIGDFDRQAGTLVILVAKGGKPRHVVLTDEGRELFGRLTVGRTSETLILTRNSTVKAATKHAPAETQRAPWRNADQHRPIKDACSAANIAPAISFHVLRHTYASRLAMRAVAMVVIAKQLGHTDTRMTERHYAHLSPSYVSDVVRASFGSLGIGLPVATVVPLRQVSV